MRETSTVPSVDRPVRAAPTGLRAAAARISALDLCAFLLPAMSFFEILVVGRLIVSEVVALALLPWLLRARDRLVIPRWLYIFWGAWLASQVVTDIVVGSAFTDWARGWAAIVFTLIDILAVATLAATPRRARIFAVGLAVGGVLSYAVDPFATNTFDVWKWGLAGPAGLILAAGLSGAVWLRRPWLVVLAFATFGWLNAALLYRSLGGMALLTAVYLGAGLLLYARRTPQRPTVRRAAATVVGYGAGGLAVFLAINLASSLNLLGDAARMKFDQQSGAGAVASQPPAASPEPRVSPAPTSGSGPGASGAPAPSVPPSGGNPFAVLLKGRAELLASPWAILDSPILGHGSWAKDPKYAALQSGGLDDLGGADPSLVLDPNLIPTHSYLLGSWVWAGLAGGLFWIAIGALALWLIANLHMTRLAISPLIAFITAWLLWDIAFSPYANSERLDASFGIAVILLGLKSINDLRVEGPRAQA